MNDEVIPEPLAYSDENDVNEQHTAEHEPIPYMVSSSPSPPPLPPSSPQPELAVGAALPASTPEVQNGDAARILDPDILDLLGEDPSIKRIYDVNLHKDIALRWTHILTNGLSKDTQAGLVKHYLPSENCVRMSAPILNPEIKAALLDQRVKQDQYSQGKQSQLGSALAALGQVLNWALSSKNIMPPPILKALSDAGRLICDNHYKESLSRRYAISRCLNINIRDTIKDTKIDDHLFGSNLCDHINSSKSITKVATEMKTFRAPFRALPTTQSQRGALNLRGNPRAAAIEPRTNPVPRRPLLSPAQAQRDRRQQPTRSRGRQRAGGFPRQQRRR